MSSLAVGVDVGGTFTDLFVLDHAKGTARIGKVPSTRDEDARGFMNGVARIADSPVVIVTIVHGTTVGTNALLERKLARNGIITTRSFRDVLEMRRRAACRLSRTRKKSVPRGSRDDAVQRRRTWSPPMRREPCDRHAARVHRCAVCRRGGAWQSCSTHQGARSVATTGSW